MKIIVDFTPGGTKRGLRHLPLTSLSVLGHPKEEQAPLLHQTIILAADSTVCGCGAQISWGWEGFITTPHFDRNIIARRESILVRLRS